MATLTKDQIQRLMDSGMSVYDIRAAAERNGDTMPGPTLFGAVASPFIKGAARFGQVIGSEVARAFGKEPVVKSSVFQAPGFGTIPIEEQQPLNTQQGKRQILGLGAELGANFVPIGRVAGALSPYVGKTLGYATGLGASGYGFETGTRLQEGAPDAYTPGLGTAIPAAIPIVGKALGATAPALRFGLAKASGLTPDEITTILTRPSEFQTARAENLNRISLGNLINERFKALKSEVSDLGKSYQPIRDSGQVVKVAESPFERVLSRMKIGFENGKVRLTSESPALSSSDVSSIERLYNQFGQTDTLSSNAYLNLRNAADELANWRTDPSRTSFSERIFRELRREYDDVAKVQIKGLKELDTQYAPVKKELTELTKEYLQFRDGQWVLKDAAVSKITNATNKGREQVLSRLEKYVPGITQQIQLVRALEGVQAASGNRVGAYAQSLLLGGGLFAAGANPAFALLALAVAMPEVLVPILIGFGKVRGVAEGAMRAFIGKLVAGKTLTEQELKLFKDALLEHLNKVSPGDQFFDSPLGQRSVNYVKNLKPGLVIEDVTKGGTLKQFNGFQDLSTKLLEKLKGRTTVSRQYIEDLSNSPDLKQAERDLIRNTLKDEGDQISVPDFANRVKSELLPLKAKKHKNLNEEFGGYEGTTLPEELRGPVYEYNERVYESPIKTSAGSVHPGLPKTDSYFAHSRYEDLANRLDEFGQPDKAGKTRRVIELQSDLFQKGRLESEMGGLVKTRAEAEELAGFRGSKDIPRSQEEFAKLEPYRNTWHERVIREEVKQAAKDGKTKLQFPTGETAMKIEGLGERNTWRTTGSDNLPPNYGIDSPLTMIGDEKPIVGLEITDGNSDWIITDVLGDGKFKAVPKDGVTDDLAYFNDAYGTTKGVKRLPDGNYYQPNDAETFDISGKVDTENPIYRFYNKEVRKYLVNKYGAKEIVDPQGVSWIEVKITPEMRRLPVEAFGVGAVPLLNQNEKGN